jgi:hypothetical protein
MAKRRATKQPKSRRNSAGGKAVVRITASKRKAKRNKTASSKTMAKRSAAAKRAVVINALSDLQRTTAQKWAWVGRQLKV